MNYQRIYDEFIADRRKAELRLLESGQYKELHHIVPRSLGGGDERENLIYLTASDHYFAHCCLAKIHGGKMWSALFAITRMTKHADCNVFSRRRMVEICRVKAAKVRSEHMKRLWRTGKFSREREYGPISESHRRAIRAASLGRRQTQESIEKARKTRQSNSPIFEFVHVETGEWFTGTQLEFRNHSGVSQPLVSYLCREKINHAKGWMLAGSNRTAVINGRDGRKFTFKHKDGDVFTGTQYEFRTKFDLDSGAVSHLTSGSGKLKTHKGWQVLNG